MSSTAIFSAPLTYAYGVIIITGAAVTYLISYAKLLLVNIFLRLTTGRTLDLLSGMDATMQFSSTSYFTQPSCPTVINVVSVFQGRLELSDLIQRLKGRVLDARNPDTGRLVNPRYKYRVERWFGYFVWVKDDLFDIRNHVRCLDDTYDDEASLVKLAERIAHTPMHEARSPWEFSICRKVTAPGEAEESAVVYRIHHSLADGMNLVIAFSSMMDIPPHMTMMKEMDKQKDNDKLANLARRNPLLHFLANPGQKWSICMAADILWNLLSVALAVPYILAQACLQKPERNSLHGPELSGRKLFALSKGIPFQVMKDIASTFNCCINDVFHYGVTRAIQKCNEESPESPTDSHVTLLVPLYMVRPNASWTQNGFTFTFMRYALQGESPQSHLRHVASVTDAMKSSAEPLINFAATQLLSNHMPLLLAKRCLAPSFDFTALATNIVGPSGECSIVGLPLTKLFFFSINHGRSGIAMSLFTLNGIVRVGVTLDRSVAKEDSLAQHLADHFEIEMQNLHKLALEQGKKSVI